MFVIMDPARSINDHSGFAVNNPIEGWHFTILLSSATRFQTEKEADEVITKHYNNSTHLIVKPVSK